MIEPAAGALAEPRKVTQQARSYRNEWVRAAFEVASRDGLANVKVMAISRYESLPRSSFYRVFSGLEELLMAVVERWHSAERQRISRLNEVFTDDAQSDLLSILDHYLASDKAQAQASGLEQWLRFSLNSKDPLALPLADIDQARLAQLSGRFALVEPDAAMSRHRAQLFYLVLRGAVGAVHEGTRTREDIDKLRAAIAAQQIETLKPY